MGNKILVVDDELNEAKNTYIQIFQEPIADQHYSLEFVRSGEEALLLIQTDKRQEICLLILDLRLEGAELDGIQLANTLAQLHIDKKIIIWTAFPEWEVELSDEAQKNVIKILKRGEYPHSYLRDLTEVFMRGQLLNFPGKQSLDKDSKLLGYQTIRKLAITLPSDLRYHLIEELLEFFPLKTLLTLKENFPLLIDQHLEKARDRDELKEWVANYQKIGAFPPKVPPALETDTFMIEIREFERGNNVYPRLYLRWSYDGKPGSIYLKTQWVETLPERFRIPPRYPNASPVIYHPISKKKPSS